MQCLEKIFPVMDVQLLFDEEGELKGELLALE
jgi:hypothetical protein